MAKLNLYEQQTSINAPRVDGEAMGAGVARAQGQFAGAAFELGVQVKRRADVIDRVQKLNDFDAYAQQGLQAVTDTEDLTKPETIDKYGQALEMKMGEVLKAHGGTSASRAELEAQLRNQVGQYRKSAMGAQVKAQQAFIGRKVEERANALSMSAAFAPEKVSDIFDQFDNDLNMFSDALSPEQQAAYKQAGRSQIAQGAISRMLTDGNWSAAKNLMNNPDVSKYLDPSSARKFAIDIVVDERKAEIETKRQDANVSRITQIAKRNLTPDEVMRARSLPEKKNMTVADKITEYELVTGKPASQAVVDEFYNVDMGGSGGGMFGNSLQGRALNYIDKNAAAYANGALSPDDARTFELMYAEAYKPIERIDPATGQWTKITPTIPAFVQDAMNRGKGSARNDQRAPRPGERIQLTLPDGRIAGQTTVGPDGTWTIVDRSAPPVEAAAPSGSPPAQTNTSNVPTTPLAAGEGGRTVWERRHNIAGPVSAITSGMNRIPGVGPAVAGAVAGDDQVRQMEADRVYAENASRDLIRVLQNNPKFAEGERAAIEKEVSIGPEAFRSVESYEAKLIGISQSLTQRKFDAQKSLNSEISIDERKRSMDIISAIDNFMGNLGIPPVVTTVDQYNSLPPGTRFMDAKGNEWSK